MKTRTDCYEFIKKNNLQEEVRNKLGRHFTNVSTANLLKFIESKQKTPSKKSAVKDKKESIDIYSKFAKMVEILGKKRILLPSEIDAICNA